MYISLFPGQPHQLFITYLRSNLTYAFGVGIIRFISLIALFALERALTVFADFIGRRAVIVLRFALVYICTCESKIGSKEYYCCCFCCCCCLIRTVAILLPKINTVKSIVIFVILSIWRHKSGFMRKSNYSWSHDYPLAIR